MYGRGVTDCLGHVAMFTNIFKQLGQIKPKLKSNVVAVFICNEVEACIHPSIHLHPSRTPHALSIEHCALSPAPPLFPPQENSSILGLGIDEMEKQGELEMLKHGPLIWVDSANFGPTIATGGVQAWELEVKGRQFHSGLPHLAVNPINVAAQAIK